MANQITGKIHAIAPTRQIASKNGGQPFFRREVILDCSTYDRYNGNLRQNFLPIEFGGNHCSDLDQYRVGDMVCISYDLQGNLYQDKQTGEPKCFSHIVGWKIERVAVAQALPPQQAVQQPQVAANPPQQQYQQPQPQYQQQQYQQFQQPAAPAPIPQAQQTVYAQQPQQAKQGDCPF